jgi:group I intron endonuclease
MYVGQSEKEPDARFVQHRYNSNLEYRKKSSAIARAIFKYGWDGFTRHVLEVCNKEDLNDAERYWISHYQSMAPGGYNLTSGGGVGETVSQETRDKISKAKKGVKKSETERQRIILMNRSRICSDETRKKMSLSQTGASRGVRSEETLKRMSEAQMGHKGTPMTEEHKERLRQLNLGKTISQEIKDKLSIMAKAQMTDEQKAKIAIGRAAYWARKRAEKEADA